MTEEIFQKIQKYELMIILHPEMGEEKTEHELKEVKELITSNGGEITTEDKWGVRDLAYRIKKQEKGFYVVLNFTMDSLKVKNLEKPLNIHQAVLRYLVSKLPEKYELKTFAEYEEERIKEMEEKKKAQQNEEEKRPVRGKPIVRKIEKKEEPVAVEEKKEKKPVKAKEEKEEPKEEKKEKKISTKSSKSTLEDVDKKLKSIIDDPDITL